MACQRKENASVFLVQLAGNKVIMSSSRVSTCSRRISLPLLYRAFSLFERLPGIKYYYVITLNPGLWCFSATATPLLAANELVVPQKCP